jgi:hypothetical protein
MRAIQDPPDLPAAERRQTEDLGSSFVAGALASVVGGVCWLTLIASAPRVSHGPHPDMGDNRNYPLLFVLVMAGGELAPRRAVSVGVCLVLPGLALAPWTAPRGDEDGLWVLDLPIAAGVRRRARRGRLVRRLGAPVRPGTAGFPGPLMVGAFRLVR